MRRRNVVTFLWRFDTICSIENDLKLDTRKSPENLYAVRKLIVRMHNKDLGPMAIKEQTDISWGAIHKAIKLYEAGGITALKPARRGCKKGTARRLTAEQEKAVQKAICSERPEQLKMDFALWTREAVMKYIEEHFGIKLPMRTVGDYLKRWGFTPEKPIKVAYEQKPEAVKQWIETQYPSISKRAREEKAEIHWADETAVMNTDVRGRSYAPRGQTPTTRGLGLATEVLDDQLRQQPGQVLLDGHRRRVQRRPPNRVHGEHHQARQLRRRFTIIHRRSNKADRMFFTSHVTNPEDFS